MTASNARWLELSTEPGAARRGRQFVEEWVGSSSAAAARDDCALVAAELITNACQHGRPPVLVSVEVQGDLVHLEVADQNPRRPVRPAPSTSNMTGRGIALVDALTLAWGVRRTDTGKAVWAKLSAARPAVVAAEPDTGHDGLPERWDDEPVRDPLLHEVVLGDVPTELLLEAKAHVDNIVREFTLAAAAADPTSTGTTAGSLAQLVGSAMLGFADARDGIKRLAIAAARRGEGRTTLVLQLPVTAAAAGAAYLAALDEADAFARAARLLTLEAPPEHRLFRQWYVAAIIESLRAADGHRPPVPARSFEEVLVGEVRRLAAAQRVSERAARLQLVTAALATTRTPEDVARVVVSEGVAALGATGGGLVVAASDRIHLAVPGAVGYDDQLVGLLRGERLDAELPAALALRTGESVWLESRSERDLRFPALQGFEADTSSMCAVPLVVVGRRLGALRFSFAEVRLFDDDERAFVHALAALTAQTLQRTELYAAERSATVGLQRALLPDRLAQPVGWRATAHYSPAGSNEVGGDFYDVFSVGDQHVVALVGDVMGRGLEAAAAMGQIRAAIRAYAIDDPSPASVMRRTDAYFGALQLEQLVTVLYLLLEVSTGRVLLCSAGHPPPVLRSEDGAAAVVDLEVGRPFGAGAEERHLTPLQLGPGASLLLYTDGLVERRGRDLETSILELPGRVSTLGRDGGAERLSRLAADLGADRHDDDVTLLLLERAGELGPGRAPARSGTGPGAGGTGAGAVSRP